MAYYSLLPADVYSLLLEKHNIRRQLLLFDKIFLFHDFEVYKNIEKEVFIIAEQAGLETFEYLKSFYRDIEELWKIGKAEQININLISLETDADAIKSKEEYLYHKQKLEFAINRLGSGEIVSEDEFIESSIHGLLASSLENRIAAAYYNKHNYKVGKIIPLVSKIENQKIENMSEMLLVTLNELPIINEAVPITEIVQYKSEKNLDYAKLLNWLNTLNTENFNFNEFNDKINFLKLEYEENLKLHRLKYSYSTFQTIISCTANVIENSLKLKIGDAVNTIFDIKKQKIELLQQEKTLPGSELSYVVSANTKF